MWINVECVYSGCFNMDCIVIDVFDLLGVIIMSRMFIGCSSFNGDIGNWNMVMIMNMFVLFVGVSFFN